MGASAPSYNVKYSSYKNLNIVLLFLNHTIAFNYVEHPVRLELKTSHFNYQVACK